MRLLGTCLPHYSLHFLPQCSYLHLRSRRRLRLQPKLRCQLSSCTAARQPRKNGVAGDCYSGRDRQPRGWCVIAFASTLFGLPKPPRGWRLAPGHISSDECRPRRAPKLSFPLQPVASCLRKEPALLRPTWTTPQTSHKAKWAVGAKFPSRGQAAGACQGVRSLGRANGCARTEDVVPNRHAAWLQPRATRRHF